MQVLERKSEDSLTSIRVRIWPKEEIRYVSTQTSLFLNKFIKLMDVGSVTGKR